MKKFKSIGMDVELIAEIEKYQKENHFSSFTQALINLVRLGIRKEREIEKKLNS